MYSRPYCRRAANATDYFVRDAHPGTSLRTNCTSDHLFLRSCLDCPEYQPGEGLVAGMQSQRWIPVDINQFMPPSTTTPTSTMVKVWRNYLHNNTHFFLIFQTLLLFTNFIVELLFSCCKESSHPLILETLFCLILKCWHGVLYRRCSERVLCLDSM